MRFIKEGPDFWLCVLPSGHLSTVVLVLKAKLLCNLLVRRLVRLDVQLVQDGQRRLQDEGAVSKVLSVLKETLHFRINLG